MNPEVKAKWLEALRSGRYKQGYQQLKDHDGNYCCLGVLCDIHAKETHNAFTGKDYLRDRFALPEIVYKWAGLSGPLGAIPTPINDHNSLADMNDKFKMTFHEIADIIEKQL